VLLRTVGELFPGVAADHAEGRLAEEVKGRAMMAGVLAAAVPRSAGGRARPTSSSTARRSGSAARSWPTPPGGCGTPGSRTNQAGPLFQRQIIAALAERYAGGSARELAERLEADVADVLAEARGAIEADLAALPEIGGSVGGGERPDLAEVRRELWADPRSASPAGRPVARPHAAAAT